MDTKTSDRLVNYFIDYMDDAVDENGNFLSRGDMLVLMEKTKFVLSSMMMEEALLEALKIHIEHAVANPANEVH